MRPAIPTLTPSSLQTIARDLASRDKVLASVYDELGPPPLWKRPATFATFIRIILEQQVSLASAKSTFDRLQHHCGGRVSANSIASIGEDGLRELGLSRQKARYATALASDVTTKVFRIGSLRHQTDSAARTAITARLGMGEWTADIFLMMALLRRDLFPVGDLALVNGLQELEQVQYDSRAAILDRAQPWRPHRSVATRMIWQAYLYRRGKTVPT